LADDNTSDEVLARYLEPAQLRALPLAPVLTVDDTKVELPHKSRHPGLVREEPQRQGEPQAAAGIRGKDCGRLEGAEAAAEGDSWFLYPILLKDIIDNLSADYAIYSVAAPATPSRT